MKHADFLLLGIISHAHADMILTAETPHVERHLESNDKNALRDFRSAFAQRMCAMVAIEILVLFWIEVGRIIVILAFAFTLEMFAFSG